MPVLTVGHGTRRGCSFGIVLCLVFTRTPGGYHRRQFGTLFIGMDGVCFGSSDIVHCSGLEGLGAVSFLQECDISNFI